MLSPAGPAILSVNFSECVANEGEEGASYEPERKAKAGLCVREGSGPSVKNIPRPQKFSQCPIKPCAASAACRDPAATRIAEEVAAAQAGSPASPTSPPASASPEQGKSRGPLLPCPPFWAPGQGRGLRLRTAASVLGRKLPGRPSDGAGEVGVSCPRLTSPDPASRYLDWPPLPSFPRNSAHLRSEYGASTRATAKLLGQPEHLLGEKAAELSGPKGCNWLWALSKATEWLPPAPPPPLAFPGGAASPPKNSLDFSSDTNVDNH